MLPAVVLVGRANVGKSTLFNQLTRSRDALVADVPGVTRDRRYGVARWPEGSFIIVDTGGLGAAAGEINTGVERQVEVALHEADSIVLVVDFTEGVTAEDERIAERLRRTGTRVTVVVNKSEGVAGDVAAAEFHALGLGPPMAVAALHAQGMGRLAARILEPFAREDPAPAGEADDARPRLAVIGRPNVGKSTLINRLVGSERLITSSEPGTTRDSVSVPTERDGFEFVLIDTAGIRRRARVDEGVEKFSVVQSLKAIEEAEVVIALLDARAGVTDQDLHLIGLTADRGRALAVGINKWDGMPIAARRRVEAEVDRQLDFVPFASVHYLSALHGSGISELVRSAIKAYRSAGRNLTTPRLNQILKDASQAHAPPLIHGRQPRLRYAHQGGRYPPLIVVHGTQVERLPDHYRRYLENYFRDRLKLKGTPVRIEFKSGDNPFAGRRNALTPRQRERRKRVIRHSRRKR